MIGLGTAIAEAGGRVRYATAANLVNELAEAASDKQLGRTIKKYGRVDLLCLDELGYVKLDRHGAELLFQIFTEREERHAIAIASNRPFTEWDQTFTDKRLCQAIVDRLTFEAHIIETGTQSFPSGWPAPPPNAKPLPPGLLKVGRNWAWEEMRPQGARRRPAGASPPKPIGLLCAHTE